MQFYDVANAIDLADYTPADNVIALCRSAASGRQLHAARSFASTSALMRDISEGRLVILVGGEQGSGHADLVMAADHVSPEAVNFMAKHGRGLVSVALTGARLETLGIARLPATEGRDIDYDSGVSVEACHGVTTGISAADRACTIAAVAGPKTLPSDLCSPGHVFPLIVRNGGVLERNGRAEAAVDIARLAGASPCAVLCQMLSSSGEMLSGSDLFEFARSHSLKIGSISDLMDYRCRHDPVLERVSDTPFASEWRRLGYRNRATGVETVVLAMGNLTQGAVPMWLHHASFRTDCLGARDPEILPLRVALDMIANQGTGVAIIVEADRGAAGLAGSKHPQRSAGRTSLDDNIVAQILFDLGVEEPVNLLEWCNRPAGMPECREGGHRSVHRN